MSFVIAIFFEVKDRNLFFPEEKLKKRNVILIREFSRLGRSMLEVNEIISIAMQKGIRIYTVKVPGNLMT
jgi:DNA invertase Pin-like site-specific DNA recombinase